MGTYMSSFRGRRCFALVTLFAILPVLGHDYAQAQSPASDIIRAAIAIIGRLKVVRDFAGGYVASKALDELIDDTKSRLEELEGILKHLEAREKLHDQRWEGRDIKTQERLSKIEATVLQITRTLKLAGDNIIQILTTEGVSRYSGPETIHVRKLIESEFGPTFQELQNQLESLDQLVQKVDRLAMSDDDLSRHIAEVEKIIQAERRRMDNTDKRIDELQQAVLQMQLFPIHAVSFWKLNETTSAQAIDIEQITYWQLRFQTDRPGREAVVTYGSAAANSPPGPWYKQVATAVQIEFDPQSARYKVYPADQSYFDDLHLTRSPAGSWRVEKLCRYEHDCIFPKNLDWETVQSYQPPKIEKQTATSENPRKASPRNALCKECEHFYRELSTRAAATEIPTGFYITTEVTSELVRSINQLYLPEGPSPSLRWTLMRGKQLKLRITIRNNRLSSIARPIENDSEFIPEAIIDSCIRQLKKTNWKGASGEKTIVVIFRWPE